MAETLMSRTFEYRQRWGHAAEPMPLVERTRLLNERLRLHDTVSEQIDAAQDAIAELLNALVKNHTESGMIRTGTTLKDAVETMVGCSERLVDSLAEGTAEHLRSPESFKVIRDALSRYFEFLELELKRIIDKVKFELQDHGKSLRFQEAAHRLWSGERAAIETQIECMRVSFATAPTLKQVDDAIAEDSGIADVSDGQIEAIAVHSEPAGSKVSGIDGAESRTIPAETGASIVLQGQPVTNITIEGEPVLPPAEAPEAPGIAHATDNPAARAMWSHLVADIWNGRIRPRSQTEWRQAMQDICERHSLDRETIGIDECARRVWWDTVASQHVLSTVRSTIQGHSDMRSFATFGNAKELSARRLFSPACAAPAGDDHTHPASWLTGAISLETPAVDIG